MTVECPHHLRGNPGYKLKEWWFIWYFLRCLRGNTYQKKTYKEFLAALSEYRAEVERTFIQKYGREPTKEDRSQRWDTKPRIPRYIGECFLKIANHLSFKPNFVNYMFKEDMISDGIENCVQYIHNFDPSKSQNPFAYFTQIIH